MLPSQDAFVYAPKPEKNMYAWKKSIENNNSIASNVASKRNFNWKWRNGKIMTNKTPKMLIAITIKMRNEFRCTVSICSLAHKIYSIFEIFFSPRCTCTINITLRYITLHYIAYSHLGCAPLHSSQRNLMWYLYWQRDESNRLFTLCYVNFYLR